MLACGSDAHLADILNSLTEEGALLEFSRHKYASNVVEAMLRHGDSHHNEKIIEELLMVSDNGRMCTNQNLLLTLPDLPL